MAILPDWFRASARRGRRKISRLVPATTIAAASLLPIDLRMRFITWVSCRVDRRYFKNKIWAGDRDTNRERTLFWLLRKATDDGVRFNLSVEHRGVEHLHRAIASNRGVLVIGVHSALLYLAGRYLHDLQVPTEFVGHNLETRIFGTLFRPRLRSNWPKRSHKDSTIPKEGFRCVRADRHTGAHGENGELRLF